MEENKYNCDETVEKFDLKLKPNPKDGIVLQLHHTIRGSKGECKRIRFSAGTFDDIHEKLACADNVGNMFILDFCELKFWKLANVGPCTALHFVPNKSDTLAAAAIKKFNIVFLDTECGKISIKLTGHTAPIKHISFSCNKLPTLLTASAAEAILWELTNYTKYFTLNTYLGAQLQQIIFTPGGEYLVACFQNDTVQIWKHESMKSVKQIIPNELKHLKNIAFTMNGRAMVMGGLAPILILFSMDTWKALKSIDLIKYNISGIHQMAFIPQLFDGGANKILAILSTDCALYFLNLESLTIMYTINPETSGIRKFVVSPSGKYFLCILQLGEVNIYNSTFVMDRAHDIQPNCQKKEVPNSSSHSAKMHKTSFTKAEIEQKMKTSMDSARLRRILMQYGEYPDKFRSIIWKSLLDTPRNRTAYVALVEKGIHPTYKDIENQFTIHSSMTLKNLKRLLSCLAHWSPLFGVMKFLPGFVFPFVKVLQKDPLLLFECVATVLFNYCQLWFEYAPFPPISVLAMIENILAEHDQQLLDHFVNIGVTSQTYALKVLETAFSEVLTCSEWLILWDHILSNEPAFFLMAVVSYNIVLRNAIIRIKTHEQLENFFHMQNAIDKKLFLKKAYVLMNETSDEIHPRNFFSSFAALAKGDCYQQFTGYPKATICLRLAKQEQKKERNRETLKDLRRKSQEKQIDERLKVKNNLRSKSLPSEDSEEENRNGGKHFRHQKVYQNKPRKASCYSENGKGDIIERNSHFKKDKENHSVTTTKTEKDKKIDTLEREVIKLMKSMTYSDFSDS